MIIVVKKNTHPMERYAVNPSALAAYPKKDWLHDPEEMKTLIDGGVDPKYIKVTADEVLEMTQAEKDAEDSLTFTDRKKIKFKLVDAKTATLIEEGFVWNDLTFSLSRQAQNNMLGVHTAIAENEAKGTIADFEASFFPITFNTIDDLDQTNIDTVADYLDFYNTGMATVRAHLDGGTALKSAIRAATTQPELDAIVDNR